MKPRLVKELIRDGVTDTVFDISYIRKQACKPETARALRNMLYAVVNDDDGTGRRARSKKVTIAGKTGTVRTIGVDGKYETRYRITFCGFSRMKIRSTRVSFFWESPICRVCLRPVTIVAAF